MIQSVTGSVHFMAGVDVKLSGSFRHSQRTGIEWNIRVFSIDRFGI